jgi:hypothetical protein
MASRCSLERHAASFAEDRMPLPLHPQEKRSRGILSSDGQHAWRHRLGALVRCARSQSTKPVVVRYARSPASLVLCWSPGTLHPRVVLSRLFGAWSCIE